MRYWLEDLKKEIEDLLETGSPDRDEWIAANPSLGKYWDDFHDYLQMQKRLAAMWSPIVDHLSVGNVTHQEAFESSEWPTVWECWNAGATLSLPASPLLIDLTEEGGPFHVSINEELDFLIWGGIAVGLQGGGMLLQPLGGPLEWNSFFHYSPVVVLPDGAEEPPVEDAIVRRPGSPDGVLPRRITQKRLSVWGGIKTSQILIGILNNRA